ncbi:MAG: TetR/AcrR family transcriptional regulator [Archangiaceae bacterium]|nr:TetR/AcrR family transcriptional regulator [Archangiaceae bacterium]
MARPRQVTDEELEAKAREAFLELGPAAPVSDIARRLGVTQAALFHRAGSKEALMLRALSPGAPQAVAVLQAGPSDGPLAGQLSPVLRSLLQFLDVAIPGLMVLRGAGVAMEGAGPPPPLALRAALTRYLTAAGARGLATLPRPAATADALLSSLEARAFNRYLGGPSFVRGSDAAFVEGLLEAVLS